MSYDPDKFPTGEQEPIMTVMFENITVDEVVEYLRLGKHITCSLIVDLDGNSVLSIGNVNGLGGEGHSGSLIASNTIKRGGRVYPVSVYFGKKLFVESVDNKTGNVCSLALRRKAKIALAQALGL